MFAAELWYNNGAEKIRKEMEKMDAIVSFFDGIADVISSFFVSILFFLFG